VKEETRTFAATWLSGFIPWVTVVAIMLAFAYLAPCGCMGGCSPQNTPNRCQGKS